MCSLMCDIAKKTVSLGIKTRLSNTTTEKYISCVQCDLPVRSVEHMLQHIKEEHGEEIDYIMVRGWGDEEGRRGERRWKTKHGLTIMSCERNENQVKNKGSSSVHPRKWIFILKF